MIYLGRIVIFPSDGIKSAEIPCISGLCNLLISPRTMEFFCNENTRIWECTDMYDI